MTNTSESALRSYVAALLAWLVPGAGHFYLGKRARAVSFFALVVMSLLIGCALDGKLYQIVPDQPLSRLATLACMGMGAPYFVVRYAIGYGGNPMSAGYDYGAAFILTAGLMNVLLILDAWDIAQGVKE